MKVLHIIDKLDVGGAEKMFTTITSLLIKKGVDTSALLFNSNGKMMHELDERLPVYHLQRENKFSLATLRKLNTICNEFDIVHVHMRHCFVYTAMAKMLCRGSYKIILHDHFGDVDINDNVPIKLRMYKPDAYIGVSTSLREWAVEKWGLDGNTAFVLRNTVRPVSYMAAPGSSPDVCLVANFRKTKNIEFAVSLFKQLRWPLTIYGQKNDPRYYEYISEMAAGADNINIITGKNSFNEILPGHNLAIHTAVSESGPLVLLEYMSAGIPFLAYNTGEIAKTVQAGLPDMFMDNFDEKHWLDRIRKIAAGEDRADTLKHIFEEQFSTEKYISDCLEIYKTVHF